MLNHPSQICVHFLGSRLVGEKNPYIPHRFVEAHKDIINIPQKVKLYDREGRVWDVQIELARSGGLVFGGPGWMVLFKFYNIKMGYIVVFDFINGIDEARFLLFDHTNIPVDCLQFSLPPTPPLAQNSPPETEDSDDMSISDESFMIIEDSVANGTVTRVPSGGLSLTTSLDAGDEDGGAYPLSQRLRFRLVSVEKKFRVSKRPRTGNIAGFKSLICIFIHLIPRVGRIVSGLTWGKRGYSEVCIDDFWCCLEKAFRFLKGLYLEILIEESRNDHGETIFEVMVFKSDGTICELNVHQY
ncbi:hypothetical protein ACFE04_001363 [Oxalis oulophora]